MLTEGCVAELNLATLTSPSRRRGATKPQVERYVSSCSFDFVWKRTHAETVANDDHGSQKRERGCDWFTHLQVLPSGFDSHVLSAEVIACSDDEEAKRRALEIVARKPACRGVEIWEFDRRVHSHLRDSVLPPLAATR